MFTWTVTGTYFTKSFYNDTNVSCNSLLETRILSGSIQSLGPRYDLVGSYNWEVRKILIYFHLSISYSKTLDYPEPMINTCSRCVYFQITIDSNLLKEVVLIYF